MFDNNEKGPEDLQVHTDKEDNEINLSSSSSESEEKTDLDSMYNQRSHEHTNEESLLKQKTKKIVLAVIASILALTLLILLFSCHFSKKTTADTETEIETEVETEPIISTIHIETPFKTTIEVGDFLTLKTSVIPESGSQEVAWFSSSEEVATINDEGRLGGLSEGSTTITATSADGATDSIKITVEARETTAPETTTEVETEAETTVASSGGSKWTGNSGNTSGGSSSSGSSSSGNSSYTPTETEAPAETEPTGWGTASYARNVANVDGEAIESYMAQYLNTLRANAGLSSSQRDSDLDKVAQYRSQQLTTDYRHLKMKEMDEVCTNVGCYNIPLTGECISKTSVDNDGSVDEYNAAVLMANGWFHDAAHWDIVSTCSKWGIGITVMSNGNIMCSIDVSNG